jgi:hypothetical protein
MEPHRCPKCDAPVVDRRSPLCTTCHEALPAEWIMTPEQIAKVEMIDRHAKAEHVTALNDLDEIPSDSNLPLEDV